MFFEAKFDRKSIVSLLRCSNQINHNEQVILKHKEHELALSNHQLNNNAHSTLIQHRQLQFYRNEKVLRSFIRRHRHRSNRDDTSSIEYLTPSCSSSLILTVHQHNRFDKHRVRSSSSKVDYRSHIYDTSSYQYYANNHILLANATRSSSAYEHFRTLLTEQTASVKQFIDYQLLLTYEEQYRSVCILIDDYKSSAQYRHSFLRSIYMTLSDSLTTITDDRSRQLTVMHLIFFNNSLYDIVTMQRLRLIDTGKMLDDA
jgi:hypothetical protein